MAETTTVLTDQEVGELWRDSTTVLKEGDKCAVCPTGTVWVWPNLVQCQRCHYKRSLNIEAADLIRKLVEERAKVRHYVDSAVAGFNTPPSFDDSPENHKERYRRKALRDFNIDPATWEMKHDPRCPACGSSRVERIDHEDVECLDCFWVTNIYESIKAGEKPEKEKGKD